MEMKKRIILSAFLLAFFIIGCVSALDISVEKTEVVPVFVSELNKPALFDFAITNNGASEPIEIYSLVGVSFEPRGTFNLPVGESVVSVKAFPGESARKKEGYYTFEYQIKGIGDDIFKDKLTIKIVKLKDVLQIEPQNIKYGDEKAVIKVRNAQNMPVENATLRIKSVFFDDGRTFSLKPFESIEIKLPIDSGSVKDLASGPYVVSSEIEMDGVSAEMKDNVNYVEQQNIVTEKSTSGWIIRTTTIKKTNEGNLAVPDKIEITKNVLTRLFASFSVEPLATERRGLLVYYRWEQELKPAESWSVWVRTNYTLPLVLIVLIIFSALAVYLYSRTSLFMSKRCSFVRTRGGEFALKVMLHVKARKSVDNIEIFDRIPMAMKLYDKAGMPHQFDERTGRLTWKIDRLNAGEERVFSYIIYSTIRIVGRLELSPAVAHFAQDGKKIYVNSNRTYFVSEIHPRY